MAPFGSRTCRRRRRGTRLPGRRPVPADRLPRDEGPPARRQRHRDSNRLEWPLGKLAREARRGEVDRAAAAGRQADDARVQPDVIAEGRRPAALAGPVQLAPVARLHARSPDTSSTRSIRTGSSLDDSWAATESTYVQFQGRTAFGEQLADAVPRHQPRLAGERPRAGRHHDGVRRADRRGADRRQRRVRRRDARVVLEAAHRGALQRRSHARVGRRLGPRRRRRRDREQLRRSSRTRS